MEKLEGLQKVKLPPNKSEKRILTKTLQDATKENPLRIFVGSCPDYSHFNGLYTHKDIGSSVPLLTQTHLQYDFDLLKVLGEHEIPLVYTIMEADVEGIDEVFCNKFTQGDRGLFLRRCLDSMEATQSLMNQIPRYINSTLRSSSFFTEFGFERFMRLQDTYQAVLQARFETDDSFQMRVMSDVSARTDMYKAMYSGVIDKLSVAERYEFLAIRTMRTMAQYLTLGRLIAEVPNSIIINHPTKNISVFNDRNKFLLPEDDSKRPQPTIPVLQMLKEVY